MIKIAPSILSANYNNMAKEFKTISKAKIIHIDVMDGHFVPNITMGPVIIQNFKKLTNALFDIHLMIDEPLKYFEPFKKAGADYVTFHYEAVKNPLEVINEAHKLELKVGISVKPNTKVEVLEPFLSLVDLILVMSVEPGFGGQKYLDSANSKIAWLKERQKDNHYLISVDGGINGDTYKTAKKLGADILVVGSYLFKKKKRNKIITSWEKENDN